MHLPLPERTVIFTGTAREAATSYPKNSNVCAMLALATAGLDDTRVTLVADPVQFGTRIKYHGVAGSLTVEIEGKASPSNPRTTAVVPLAVIKALKNLSSSVVIGV